MGLLCDGRIVGVFGVNPVELVKLSYFSPIRPKLDNPGVEIGQGMEREIFLRRSDPRFESGKSLLTTGMTR